MIFWLMFIYFMMQGMDELGEFSSQAFELEKGALGLFFEMNHFIGLGLTGYMLYFIVGVKAADFGQKNPKQTDKQKVFWLQYKIMRSWIYF